MTRPRLSLPALAVLGLVLCASPALAKTANGGPNWEAAPFYTTLKLLPKFINDPATVAIEAGGGRTIEGLASDCKGYINWDRPDVDIDYASEKEPGSPAGSERLHIYVKAAGDATLLVYTPDQKWICADDISETDTTPLLTFEKPQAGNYNIWVGTPRKDEAMKATVYVSENAPPRKE